MLEPREIAVMMKAVGEHVQSYVASATAPLLARIAELEAQIKAIPAGPQGERGVDGKDGGIGPIGPAGIDGKDGLSITGPRGLDGINGNDGVSITGERGIDGKDGLNGRDGINGKDGVSITGERGIDGKDGLNGRDGINGKDGKPGEPGISAVGSNGIDGKDGADGRDGRDAKDGRDGKDGEPGRDALQIEILPMIDPAKSYPRGTFAKHAGGLVRAIRNAASVDDWETIVDGIASFGMEHDGEREFSFNSLTTSGLLTREAFTVPVLIYRDVFKDGTTYQHGDVVTWGGSAWHCQVQSTKARPGEGSTDWKLIVKRGGDGKPGANGTNGGPGPQGLPGKDLTQMDGTGRKW